MHLTVTVIHDVIESNIVIFFSQCGKKKPTFGGLFLLWKSVSKKSIKYLATSFINAKPFLSSILIFSLVVIFLLN